MTIDFAKVSYRSGIGGSAGETPRREVAEVARLSAMTVAERRTHDTHSFVVSSLGQRIGAGELVPSTDLTLASLEAEYGVSRTVVREAVRVLESKGMLVSRRRIGLVVQPVENWDLLDRSVIQWRLAGSHREQLLLEMMEVRAALEPEAARLAAVRATDAQRARLVALAEELERLGLALLGDGPDFLKADNAFHSLLLEASGNLLLSRMRSPVTEVHRGRVDYKMLKGLPEAGTLEGHLAVAHAVADGDPEAAARASFQLLQIIYTEIQTH